MDHIRQRKPASSHTGSKQDIDGSLKKRILNPITTHYEFMGPHGTLLAILGLPLTTVGLFLVCNKDGCPPSWLLDAFVTSPASISTLHFQDIVWIDKDAILCVLGWMLMHIVFSIILPGRLVKGTLLRTGDILDYRINGFAALIACTLLTMASYVYARSTHLVWIADHALQLGVASMLFSTIMSLLLYLSSFRSQNTLLAEGGNSGYPIYDFWMGRELNPRILGGWIDLKYMCELRPGLIGWALLNLAFCVKQYTQIGRTTNSMVAVVVFQAYYVIDALWNEQAILTTMDITTDGFGFMLAFGDLVWVPFVYTLQARYLCFFPVDLSYQALAAIVALNLVGLWVFRGANGQKNAFRSDPNGKSVKHLKYMHTKSGSKLLLSGWWGCARKINYTGDWLMALAWCLPCGFDTPIPYFYAIYFAILLIHRAHRDESKCRAKYGSDWDEYRKKVRYLFIPYVW